MRYLFFASLGFVLIFLLFPSSIQAQNIVELKSTVGRYYFFASGLVSPYASVVMTSQDYFLSSTVADSEGRFFLPQALVNDGFNNFCLEAVDIRRIGTSYTCFDVEIPNRDFSKDQIFLPPTVGLSGRKIEPNSSITASGYSMPGSKINVKLDEKYWIETVADVNGYYKTDIGSDVPPGKYELYATAVYEVKKSEKPTRTFPIEVLGLFQMIPAWLIGLSILILILMLLIILFIILWKRRRKDKKQKQKKKSNPPH